MTYWEITKGEGGFDFRDALICLALLALTSAIFLTEALWLALYPHDYGQLGMSAQLVLEGGRPHADFQEPYTGLLNYINALGFNILGVRLSTLHRTFVPWVLGFVLAYYYLARRFFGCFGAALLTVLGVFLGPLQYTAPMPSWYGLVLITFQLVFLALHRKRASLLLPLLSGVCGGISIAIKISAVFPVLMIAGWLLVFSVRVGSSSAVTRLYLICLFLLAVFPLAHLGIHSHWISHGVPLLLACCGLNALGQSLHRPSIQRRDFLLYCGGVGIGFLPLLSVYSLSELPLFFHSAFFLPSLRFSFAATPPPYILGVCGIVGILWVFSRTRGVRELTASDAALCLLPLLMLSFWSTGSPALGLFFVPLGLSILSFNRIPQFLEREAGEGGFSFVYLLIGVACASCMIQVPFFTLIYLFYSFPLVLLAFAAFVKTFWRPYPSFWMAVVATLLVVGLVFDGQFEAIASSMNDDSRRLRTELGDVRFLSRDADAFDELLPRLREEPGGLYAGPDCPEVYFLSGKPSPLSSFYEFFEPVDPYPQLSKMVREGKIKTVIFNRESEFSPPIPSWFRGEIQEALPYRGSFGRFDLFGGM